MAKDKFGEDNNDNKYGDYNLEDKFEHSEEDSNSAFPSEKVTLVFKQNRKKELHVDKKVYTFWGPGDKISVDKCVIEHEDFKNQAKYFLVKEA